MKILLDYGHCLTGADTGARGILVEEKETRNIGQRVKAKLEALGHTVVVCSVDSAINVNQSLQARVDNANNSGGDLYVSIHLNCGGGHGVEVYSFKETGKGHEYAQKVLNEIVALGYTNRGTKTANFYVLRETKMSAILIETLFCDSQSDCSRYNPEAMANAIVKGITGQVAPVSKPAPQPQVLGYGTVTANVLNVRDGATTTSKILGTLKRGTKVKIGLLQNGWYNIYFGDHGGWVKADFIKR